MAVDVRAAPRPQQTAEARTASRWDPVWAAWLCFGCVLGGAFLFLVLKGRGLTFFYDEWSWIEYRNSGLHSVLASYNDHMLVIPLATFQALFHTVGLDSYGAYRVAAIVSHLLCAAAVFEFARRRLGAAGLLLATPIAFLGVGWENELLPLNFGLPGSLAFGIGAFLALERRDRRGNALACGLLIISLLFAELGALFAVGIAAAQLLRDRGLRRAWIWLAPLAIYGAWWVAYYEPLPTSHSLSKVPKFAADMAASAAGGLFDAGLQRGRVILIAVVALVGWRVIRRRALSPTLVGLLVIVFGFWLLVAFGRTELGLAWASHYVYIGAVLIVLIVAESFRGARLTLKTLPIAALLAAISLVGNIEALGRGVASLRASSRAVRSELGGLELARGVAPASLVLDAYYAPQIQAGPYFAAVRALGSPSTDTPAQLTREGETERSAADDVLGRAGELVVSSSPPRPAAPIPGEAPIIVRTVSGAWTRRAQCVEFHPRRPAAPIELELPPTGLELRLPPGPVAQVFARRYGSGFTGTAIASAVGGQTTIIRAYADRSHVPWRLEISPSRTLRACTLGGTGA